MNLPFELIRIFRRKGVIKPIFLREPLGILDTLIGVYRDHIDKKRGQLKDVVAYCEHLGYDFRLVRGIASVLDSRAIFHSKSSIPPIDARRQVFTEAATTIIASKDERKQVLEAVAERNGISVKELDDSLYADLDDEHYLIRYKAPRSEELMRYYNYANMTALLAYSLRLEIGYKGTDEYLEHLIGRLAKSKITGSHSKKAVLELKPTRRLRNRAGKIDAIMSKLISKPYWSLRATIKYPARYKTPCIFEIESKDYGKLLAIDAYEKEIIIEIGTSKKKPSKYGDIVVIDEIAKIQGTTMERILKEIKEERTKYLDLGGVLVTPDKFDEIKKHLKNLSTLGDVQKFFKELGVRDFMSVLESFGYQVEWCKPHKNSKIYLL